MKHILLHICCGPCSIFPIKRLQEESLEITGYFYNPNIHPYKEFTRRLNTLSDYAKKIDLALIIDDRYTLEEFLSNALQLSSDRCQYCYELRLREAARYAKSHAFDSFTTTLLVSPYQKHELIRQVGEQIGREEGIPFYYIDLRPGWQEGVTISREMEMYRQPYCGCIFSEKERYLKKPK